MLNVSPRKYIYLTRTKAKSTIFPRALLSVLLLIFTYLLPTLVLAPKFLHWRALMNKLPYWYWPSKKIYVLKEVNIWKTVSIMIRFVLICLSEMGMIFCGMESKFLLLLKNTFIFLSPFFSFSHRYFLST